MNRYSVFVQRRTANFTVWAVYDNKHRRAVPETATRNRDEAVLRARQLNTA